MRNQKGFVVAGALFAYIIIGMVLLFVPNPVSNVAGIGVRPNKTVLKDSYKETVELIKDKDGNIIGQKTIAQSNSSDVDKQQNVTLWQSLVALPRLILILSILGLAGVPGFGWVIKIYRGLKNEYNRHRTETKKMVLAMDQAFATISLTLAGERLPGEIDRAALAEKIKKNMLTILSTNYDQSTKDLVRELRGL